MPVPPPPGFRPVCGAVSRVTLEENKWTPPRADTQAKRAGMLFEEKAHLKLNDLFADAYKKSPAIFFEDQMGIARCIPDGIIVKDNIVCVVEVKLSHTPNAWWQLRKLYGPLCEQHFGIRPKVLEIVKNYEPIGFPERVHLVYEIFDHVLNAKPEDFGVLRWKL